MRVRSTTTTGRPRGRGRRRQVSASSSRTVSTSTTRTRHTSEVWTCSMSPTTTWTWFRRAETRAMPGWTAGSAVGTIIRTDVTQPGALGNWADQTNQAARFCPACRLWAAAPPGGPGAVHVEIAPPALTALAFLAVAAIAWWLMVQQSRSMDGMAMGGSLGPFAASWTVMMAAMMLPSALPLVFEFARNAEGRRGWQTATGVLGATYLSIWLAFGIACYLVRAVVPASWFDQR